MTVHLLVIINISKRQGCHVAACIQQNSSAEHSPEQLEITILAFSAILDVVIDILLPYIVGNDVCCRRLSSLQETVVIISTVHASG